MIFNFSSILAQSLSQSQWQIQWHWSLPLWTSVLAFFLVLFFIGRCYACEISPAGKSARIILALMRLTAILLVVYMLAQPTLQWFQYAQPRLVLLIDKSASMGIEDVQHSIDSQNSNLTRLEAVKQLLVAGKDPLIDRFSQHYQLDIVAFDTSQTLLKSEQGKISNQLLSLASTTESASGTNLGQAFNYAIRDLAGAPPAATVLFSDGISTQGPLLDEVLQQNSSVRIPIYAVAVGSEKRRPDVSVSNLLVEDLVFPGDHLQVEATLRAVGLAGQMASIKLSTSESQAVVAQTEVTLPSNDQSLPILLSIRPTEPGVMNLQLSVEPHPSEINQENNIVSQAIEVTNKKIRTLLVQASPSYEFRALKSLLERDPAIDMQILLQEADSNFPEVEQIAIAEFPTAEQLQNQYDVIILGDVNPNLMSRQVWPALERFVAQSAGGLIMIAGPNYLPRTLRDLPALQLLLPVEYSGSSTNEELSTKSYSILPTKHGQKISSLQLGNTPTESAAIWNSLPPVSWRISAITPKPGAQILATSISNQQQLPMILRHYVGAGEVLFHATDETWRWRWRTDDRYFARYWGQAVRRLGRARLASGRQGIELTTNRENYVPGESVRIQLRYRNPNDLPSEDSSAVVVLAGESHHKQEIVLHQQGVQRGIYTTVLTDLLPDKYELHLPSSPSSENVHFQIKQPPKELARVATDRITLQKAADITGGKLISLDSAAKLLDELPQTQQRQQIMLPEQKLWNNHLIMTLFVLILTSEWLLRRRLNML